MDLKLKWFVFGGVGKEFSRSKFPRDFSLPFRVGCSTPSTAGACCKKRALACRWRPCWSCRPLWRVNTCLVPLVWLKKQAPMQPKSKTDYYQTHLTFPQKDLWEKFPPSQRVRCRELIVQLLRAVVLTPAQPRRRPEREA